MWDFQLSSAGFSSVCVVSSSRAPTGIVGQGPPGLSAHLRSTSSTSGARRDQVGPLPPLPLVPSRSCHPKHKKYIGETCVSFQLTHIFQLLLPKLRFDSIRDSHTRPLRNLSPQLFVFVLLVKIGILVF